MTPSEVFLFNERRKNVKITIFLLEFLSQGIIGFAIFGLFNEPHYLALD